MYYSRLLCNCCLAVAMVVIASAVNPTNSHGQITTINISHQKMVNSSSGSKYTTAGDVLRLNTNFAVSSGPVEENLWVSWTWEGTNFTTQYAIPANSVNLNIPVSSFHTVGTAVPDEIVCTLGTRPANSPTWTNQDYEYYKD